MKRLKAQNGPRKTNKSPERDYFERAVALEEERGELSADIKALWDEAKRHPEMDAKTLKTIKLAVRLHLKDPEIDRQAYEIETAAREMLTRLLGGTPLGDYALGVPDSIDPETGEVAPPP